MNSFVAVVQNNYIFTNRLSGLSVGDSVYHYDKLGDKKSVHLWEQYPLYYCNRNEKGMLNKYIYQGTGKITQLYKVVDIVHLNVNDLQHLEHLEGYNNQAYLITVTHIKDLDMELNQFYNYNKKFKVEKNDEKHFNPIGSIKRQMIEYGNLLDDCKLTKYNGLTKVIMIGGE